MKGIEIRIDNLGRVLIPVEYRRKLGIVANDKLLLSVSDSSIVLLPLACKCAICSEIISSNAEIKLCKKCITKVKKYEA